MPTTDLIVAVVAGLLVAGAAVVGWRRWRIIARRRAEVRSVLSVGCDALRDVLVPDGAGGALHADFLLLTGRGILVIDLRDVAGVIFGSEHMTDWTVMNRTHRSTFPNPLSALYDRIAAVKLTSGESAVEGRIVFTDQAHFPKGRPPQVTLLSSLLADFPVEGREAAAIAAERWRAGWDRLKAECTPSPLARP